MSIKIYDAYRIVEGTNLWDLIRDMQVRGTKIAHKVLASHLKILIANVRIDSEAFKPVLDKYMSNWVEELNKGLISDSDVVEIAKHRFCADRMEESYKDSYDHQRRSGFDYDASICFYELDGKMYARIFADGPMRVVFNPWRGRQLRDYSYVNSCDRPVSITKKDWDTRLAVWEKLLDHDVNRKQNLKLEIMSPFWVRDWIWRERGRFTEPIHKRIKEKRDAQPNV